MKPIVLMSAAILATMAVVTPAAGQNRGQTTTGIEPCCSITALDAGKHVVTARNSAGRTFQFAVPNAALFRSLKIGQSVFADFNSGNVRIHGVEPCCNILAQSVVSADAGSRAPCCSVTAINANGVVTAREVSSGRVFRFEVKEAALLKSLSVGQQIFADFGSSKVRIYGVEPCCNIVGHGIGIQ